MHLSQSPFLGSLPPPSFLPCSSLRAPAVICPARAAGGSVTWAAPQLSPASACEQRLGSGLNRGWYCRHGPACVRSVQHWEDHTCGQLGVHHKFIPKQEFNTYLCACACVCECVFAYVCVSVYKYRESIYISKILLIIIIITKYIFSTKQTDCKLSDVFHFVYFLIFVIDFCYFYLFLLCLPINIASLFA